MDGFNFDLGKALHNLGHVSATEDLEPSSPSRKFAETLPKVFLPIIEAAGREYPSSEPTGEPDPFTRSASTFPSLPGRRKASSIASESLTPQALVTPSTPSTPVHHPETSNNLTPPPPPPPSSSSSSSSAAPNTKVTPQLIKTTLQEAKDNILLGKNLPYFLLLQKTELDLSPPQLKASQQDRENLIQNLMGTAILAKNKLDENKQQSRDAIFKSLTTELELTPDEQQWLQYLLISQNPEKNIELDNVITLVENSNFTELGKVSKKWKKSALSLEKKTSLLSESQKNNIKQKIQNQIKFKNATLDLQEKRNILIKAAIQSSIPRDKQQFATQLLQHILLDFPPETELTQQEVLTLLHDNITSTPSPSKQKRAIQKAITEKKANEFLHKQLASFPPNTKEHKALKKAHQSAIKKAEGNYNQYLQKLHQKCQPGKISNISGKEQSTKWNNLQKTLTLYAVIAPSIEKGLAEISEPVKTTSVKRALQTILENSSNITTTSEGIQKLAQVLTTEKTSFPLTEEEDTLISKGLFATALQSCRDLPYDLLIVSKHDVSSLHDLQWKTEVISTLRKKESTVKKAISLLIDQGISKKNAKNLITLHTSNITTDALKSTQDSYKHQVFANAFSFSNNTVKGLQLMVSAIAVESKKEDPTSTELLKIIQNAENTTTEKSRELKGLLRKKTVYAFSKKFGKKGSTKKELQEQKRALLNELQDAQAKIHPKTLTSALTNAKNQDYNSTSDVSKELLNLHQLSSETTLFTSKQITDIKEVMNQLYEKRNALFLQEFLSKQGITADLSVRIEKIAKKPQHKGLWNDTKTFSKKASLISELIDLNFQDDDFLQNNTKNAVNLYKKGVTFFTTSLAQATYFERGKQQYCYTTPSGSTWERQHAMKGLKEENTDSKKVLSSLKNLKEALISSNVEEFLLKQDDLLPQFAGDDQKDLCSSALDYQGSGKAAMIAANKMKKEKKNKEAFLIAAAVLVNNKEGEQEAKDLLSGINEQDAENTIQGLSSEQLAKLATAASKNLLSGNKLRQQLTKRCLQRLLPDSAGLISRMDHSSPQSHVFKRLAEKSCETPEEKALFAAITSDKDFLFSLADRYVEHTLKNSDIQEFTKNLETFSSPLFLDAIAENTAAKCSEKQVIVANLLAISQGSVRELPKDQKIDSDDLQHLHEDTQVALAHHLLSRGEQTEIAEDLLVKNCESLSPDQLSKSIELLKNENFTPKEIFENALQQLMEGKQALNLNEEKISFYLNNKIEKRLTEELIPLANVLKPFIKNQFYEEPLTTVINGNREGRNRLIQRISQNHARVEVLAPLRETLLHTLTKEMDELEEKIDEVEDESGEIDEINEIKAHVTRLDQQITFLQEAEQLLKPLTSDTGPNDIHLSSLSFQFLSSEKTNSVSQFLLENTKIDRTTQHIIQINALNKKISNCVNGEKEISILSRYPETKSLVQSLMKFVYEEEDRSSNAYANAFDCMKNFLHLLRNDAEDYESFAIQAGSFGILAGEIPVLLHMGSSEGSMNKLQTQLATLGKNQQLHKARVKEEALRELNHLVKKSGRYTNTLSSERNFAIRYLAKQLSDNNSTLGVVGGDIVTSEELMFPNTISESLSAERQEEIREKRKIQATQARRLKTIELVAGLPKVPYNIKQSIQRWIQTPLASASQAEKTRIQELKRTIRKSVQHKAGFSVARALSESREKTLSDKRAAEKQAKKASGERKTFKEKVSSKFSSEKRQEKRAKKWTQKGMTQQYKALNYNLFSMSDEDYTESVNKKIDSAKDLELFFLVSSLRKRAEKIPGFSKIKVTKLTTEQEKRDAAKSYVHFLMTKKTAKTTKQRPSAQAQRSTSSSKTPDQKIYEQLVSDIPELGGDKKYTKNVIQSVLKEKNFHSVDEKEQYCRSPEFLRDCKKEFDLTDQVEISAALNKRASELQNIEQFFKALDFFEKNNFATLTEHAEEEGFPEKAIQAFQEDSQKIKKFLQYQGILQLKSKNLYERIVSYNKIRREKRQNFGRLPDARIKALLNTLEYVQKIDQHLKDAQ